MNVQAALAWPVLLRIAPPSEQGWWVGVGNREVEPSGDDLRRYHAAGEGLTERLHVAEFDSWGGATDRADFPPSRRFTARGTHRLFPPEWQAAALRTWLPAGLLDWLTRACAQGEGVLLR